LPSYASLSVRAATISGGQAALREAVLRPITENEVANQIVDAVNHRRNRVGRGGAM
jgi:hypothetical protein